MLKQIIDFPGDLVQSVTARATRLQWLANTIGWALILLIVALAL